MKINFENDSHLIPAIIQDDVTLQVLMLGYMNEAAFLKTQKEGKVTFFSRSKNRLWTKGETSENYLIVNRIEVDCDNDTILIKVTALGPTCHKGTTSCFGDGSAKGFLYKLENTIAQRLTENDDHSYTNRIFNKGIQKIAQKVGEEAVELVIEAVSGSDELFKNEAADLLYHFLILLKAKSIGLQSVEQVLLTRMKTTQAE